MTLPTEIPLQAYLVLAAMLFCTGVWGLINSRNAVRVLMSIELMLNAVNINLMAFSDYLDGQLIRGQVFAIFRDHRGGCRGGRGPGDPALPLPQP
jgi:NAD(P)H-quinone oxidoreductase subunit 4L